MRMMEIAYHEVMAQALLQVQQAQAKVEARKLIVDGAVGIIQDALDGLEEQNMRVKDKDKTSLVKRLMIVNCADPGSSAKNTIMPV